MDQPTSETQAWRPPTEPTVGEFGPWRAIGMSYIGKNEHGEIPAFWGNTFLPRVGEIAKPATGGVAFGLCRCLPGVTDGSFEYIAAFEADATAPVPAGMIEIAIPCVHYAVFNVRNLTEIGPAWQYTQQWFAAHSEWVGYCGPAGCECAEYPNFELYPPDFRDDRPLYLYFPVKAR